jgi:hypothetical protein
MLPPTAVKCEGQNYQKKPEVNKPSKKGERRRK